MALPVALDALLTGWCRSSDKLRDYCENMISLCRASDGERKHWTHIKVIRTLYLPTSVRSTPRGGNVGETVGEKVGGNVPSLVSKAVHLASSKYPTLSCMRVYGYVLALARHPLPPSIASDPALAPRWPCMLAYLLACRHVLDWVMTGARCADSADEHSVAAISWHVSQVDRHVSTCSFDVMESDALCCGWLAVALRAEFATPPEVCFAGPMSITPYHG